MRGNLLVPFLEGLEAAMPPATRRTRKRAAMYLAGCLPYLPTLVRPSARMTKRLQLLVQAVGLAVGGEAGSRLAGRLGVRVTVPTLLRCLRRTPLLEATTVRVLGIDDWSYKRGQTFGTILVDLEDHRVIDLLPDREAETVATWRVDHPGVEIISCDRAGAYADDPRKGEPTFGMVSFSNPRA